MQSPFVEGIEGRISVRGTCHGLEESVLVSQISEGA